MSVCEEEAWLLFSHPSSSSLLLYSSYLESYLSLWFVLILWSLNSCLTQLKGTAIDNSWSAPKFSNISSLYSSNEHVCGG